MSFDIGSTTSQTQTVEEKPEIVDVKGGFSSGEGYKYNSDYHQMADFLGLEGDTKMDYDIAQKVGFLRDFTGEKEEVDAKVKIKQMIRDLGFQMKGKELVTKLYHFARLMKDRERIDKELGLIKENEPAQG